MAAQRHHLRVFRPRKDIFTAYNDTELISRYRLDSGGMKFVTDLVRNELTSPTKRNMAIDADSKVAITLRYLATGKMQLCNGDDFGVSQPTVSNVITDTLNALCTPQLIGRFIRMPINRQEIQHHQRQFHEIGGFPGVVGVIDGTHVRIISPTEHENEYVNRKIFHSLNVQVVFDSDDRISDIIAKWPGATHDSRILNESGVRLLFDHGIIPNGCHLLGDSGYPCRRWLLTPFINPQAGQGTRYNSAHRATRCVVERAIGQLKRRFRVLHGEIRLKPEKAAKVITVCAMLHNICKDRNIGLPQGVHQ
ncbi:putative nuclease HARBI1 [Haliotis asinina]|uniref:putative nuclease HARBI1 n=1 Tax=Haliotis asinina TaxID=109174 RepID=UPI003532612A